LYASCMLSCRHGDEVVVIGEEGHSGTLRDTQGHSGTLRDTQGHSGTLAVSVPVSVPRCDSRVPLSCVGSPNEASSNLHT